MMRPKVLFLCTANRCRTQMAEAFLRDLAGDRFDEIQRHVREFVEEHA